MSRGRLKPEDEKCIQQNYKYLKEHLDALDIVDYLYQHQVITLEDKEQIYKVNLTRTERNEILLMTLLKAGPGEAFNHFLKSLEEQYQSVREQINRTAQEQKCFLLLQEEIITLNKKHVSDEENLKSLELKNQSLTKELAQNKSLLEALHQEFNSIKAKDEETKKTLVEQNKSYQNQNSKDQVLIQSLLKENEALRKKLSKDQKTLWKENKALKDKLTKDQVKMESLMEDNQVHQNQIVKYKALKDIVQKELNSLKIKFNQCTCQEEELNVNKDDSDNTEDIRDEFQMLSSEGFKTVSGIHESEILKLGEDESHNKSMNCKKSPQHEQFFPVETFGLNDLPVGCREYHWLGLIKALAVLTVRVDVEMTSMARPEFIPGTHCPYPFSNVRGSTALRSGSGFVEEITPCDRRDKIPKLCSCSKCRQSNKPRKKFWTVHVKTSKQVVYDKTEASLTSIRLFYDAPNSPPILLDTCKQYNSGTLVFETCAMNICNQLENALQDYSEADRKARTEYYKLRALNNNKSDINDWPVFIVSHPHGGSKRITIGDRHAVVKVDQFYRKLLYTTSTCPGSSGAPVYHITEHYLKVHGGSMDNGLNYSEHFSF